MKKYISLALLAFFGAAILSPVVAPPPAEGATDGTASAAPDSGKKGKKGKKHKTGRTAAAATTSAAH